MMEDIAFMAGLRSYLNFVLVAERDGQNNFIAAAWRNLCSELEKQ